MFFPFIRYVFFFFFSFMEFTLFSYFVSLGFDFTMITMYMEKEIVLNLIPYVDAYMETLSILFLGFT